MITLTFLGNYLAIKTYKDIDSVHLSLSLSKDEYTIECYGIRDIAILIYPDGAVMTARPNFDRKYYPTTVKNVIQRLPGDDRDVNAQQNIYKIGAKVLQDEGIQITGLHVTNESAN